MLQTFEYPRFAYRRPPELEGAPPRRYPVVVVGAGPVGLCAAIDLARQGTPVLLLDNDDTVSIGSRGVCYAKRALEVLDRLGCGDDIVAKGVSWNVGRTFFRDGEVYHFALCAEADHQRPGMINLQQYHLESTLVQHAQTLPLLELRWRNEVIAVQHDGDGATLRVETPDGAYTVHADWLIVADGARSPLRHQLGLDIDGKIFMDRFLIADVVMQAEFPAERWFWFDPPFHPGQSVLLHRQADNVWRIDFQLGWDADPEEEKKPEKVLPRIRAMLGDARPFQLEWVSVYTFQCRRMHHFRHGRVLFAGDAAHQVSPFGARGANSGIQDTDNLTWKLKLVLDGLAPASLLDSYDAERTAAADENILNSTRATDFITPKSKVSQQFRNAVLQLAREHPFARALVNSGRLSLPAVLTTSPLNTPDQHAFAGDMVPGAALADAPLAGDDGACWLLRQLGDRFTLLYYCNSAAALPTATAARLARLADARLPVTTLLISADGSRHPGLATLGEVRHRFAERYDARDGSCYLVRPDQHLAARWRSFDPEQLARALDRACGRLAANL